MATAGGMRALLTSCNIFDMQHDNIMKKLIFNHVRRHDQGQSDLKMEQGNLPSQDASTYQIWNRIPELFSEHDYSRTVVRGQGQQSYRDPKIVFDRSPSHTPILDFCPI